MKQSFRYIALALTLLAFTSTVQTASAQSTCPTDSCVVTGGNPEPMGFLPITLLVLSTLP